MENNKADSISQEAIDASYGYVTEQLQIIASQHNIPIGLLWDLVNYGGVTLSPHDKTYAYAYNQIPENLREYVLSEINRIELEAERVMTSI